MCRAFSECAMVLLLVMTGGRLYGRSRSDAGIDNSLVTSRQECLGVPNCVSIEKEVVLLSNEQAVLAVHNVNASDPANPCTE